MTISAPRLATLLGDEPLLAPAYRDLTERLRMLIVDGRLPDGIRLPSERELATAVGVSRTTSTRAYAELKDLGFVVSRQGSGSVVRVPFRASTISNLILDPESPDDIPLNHAAPVAPPGLGTVFSAAAEQLPGLLTTTGYLPDGLPQLREAIADAHTADGLRTDPSQIVVTCGAMGAINLAADTFLRPGARMVVEGASFPYAHDSFIRAGARLSPLPLADHPWDPVSLNGLLNRGTHQAAYLIPDFHNPTGAVMPDDVRRKWATLLRRHDVIPLVDETLRRVNLDGDALPPPFATYDPRAITFGSFSKAYWGGLRIGWARVPQPRLMEMLQARMHVDLGASAYEQLVATHLLRHGSNVARQQRDRTRAARDHLLEALGRALPQATVTRPAGGLNLWLTFPAPVSTRLAAAAGRQGLLLTPGPRFFARSGGERNLRLPYTQPIDVLDRAVERLASAYAALDADPGTPRSTSSMELIA